MRHESNLRLLTREEHAAKHGLEPVKIRLSGSVAEWQAARDTFLATRPIPVGRDSIVTRMAEHLVAAILHDGLNTSSDIDVITTLYNSPERFPSRTVLDHMDDALYEAKQTLIAREMGED